MLPRRTFTLLGMSTHSEVHGGASARKEQNYTIRKKINCCLECYSRRQNLRRQNKQRKPYASALYVGLLTVGSYWGTQTVTACDKPSQAPKKNERRKASLS